MRRFDEHGTVIGEHRFLGLFTSSAYNSNPIDVPLLRRKVAAVVERAGFLPASHDQKDLIAILETYPRDDLFQIGVDALYTNAMGILRLQERRQVRMFVTREIFGRFVSCMVFLPRDRYTTPVRLQIADILTEAFRARSHEWNVRLGESVLARLHFVLHVDPRDATPDDLDALEARIAAATRAWVDDLREALVAARGEEDGLEILHQWGEAFPAAYRDDFDAEETLADLAVLRDLEGRGGLSVRLGADGDHRADLKLYGAGRQPSLSEVLPSLTNMGVVIEDERPYDISRAGSNRVGSSTSGSASPSMPSEPARPDISSRRRSSRCRAAPPKTTASIGSSCSPVCRGARCPCSARTAGTSGRLGTLYSQTYIADALAAHPDIARGLVECFVTRLDPWLNGQEDTDRLVDQIEAAIDRVETLDEDRILRSLLAPRARDAAHELVPARPGRRVAGERRHQGRSVPNPRRAAAHCRCSRSSCTHRASKASTCARAASRAAASAGPTGVRTSAPRSSD